MLSHHEHISILHWTGLGTAVVVRRESYSNTLAPSQSGSYCDWLNSTAGKASRGLSAQHPSILHIRSTEIKECLRSYNTYLASQTWRRLWRTLSFPQNLQTPTSPLRFTHSSCSQYLIRLHDIKLGSRKDR